MAQMQRELGVGIQAAQPGKMEELRARILIVQRLGQVEIIAALGRALIDCEMQIDLVVGADLLRGAEADERVANRFGLGRHPRAVIEALSA